MKVIQVISDSNIGGAGKVVLNMLEYLDRSRINCKVIVPSSSRLIPLIEKLGYKVIEIDNLAEHSFDYKLIREFLNIFKAEKPDIVHTHASLSARIAAKILGIKVVYTRHWLGGEKTNFIAKFLNNYFCDVAVAVSQCTANSLISTGISEKKINIVHNGIVTMKKYSQVEKKILRGKYGFGDEFIIGTMVRLEKVKGLRYFIDAAADFLNYNSDAMVLIFGEGSLRDELENYVHKLGKDGKILFMGFADDVEASLNLLDVFVLPSLQEALSLALVEAMSVGCCCVSTDCGGPSEIIKDGENGFLVPVRDSAAIFEAVDRLFKDEQLRAKFSDSGAESANKNFTAKGMTDKIMAVYEGLVKDIVRE